MILLAATALAAQPATPPGEAPGHGKGSYADSPRRRIYHETEGQGPAVFLVAGGPGASHAGFHPWFSRLAADHTVVYFDNVGRGRSDDLAPGRKYTIAGDADDIEALRQHLKLERISLIGHSYGGFPAMAYALEHPDRVDRLVLTNTLHNAKAFQANIDNFNLHCRNQYPEIWEKLLSMRRKGIKSSAAEYGRIYYQAEADMYWADPANAGRMFVPAEDERRFSPAVYLSMVGDDPEWTVGGTMKGYDPSARMRAYRGPVLVCAGRFDRVAMPRIASEIAALLPCSRLVIFEHSGHRPWVEETDLYFDTVRRFLTPSGP
jgi:proline iminopeptidase